MERKIRTFLCVVLAAMVVCTGCAASGQKETKKEAVKTLPKYEELSSLVGLTMEDVLKTKQWQQSDLTEAAIGSYETPLAVRYEEVAFNVQVGFDVFTEKLNTVSYVAEYTADAEGAANAVMAIAGKLEKELGKHDSTTHDSSELKKDALIALFKEKSVSRRYMWDLTTVATKEHAEYIKDLEGLDTHENLGRMLYCLALELSYNEQTQTAYIIISYGVRPKFHMNRT